MSFLYPLFLTAGAVLAIPVLIHLFNLRRYKTILFPHTRFLKNIQLNSRKQSRVRYKLLLTARLLFLASLILAFAQPYFNSAIERTTGDRLQIIYIDNSYSMSVKKGAIRALDIACESARRQVKQSKPGSKFILLTNDKPSGYYPVPAEKVYEEINNIQLSPAPGTINRLLSVVQSICMQGQTGGEGHGVNDADVYYYSDFQQSSFTQLPNSSLLQHITFYALPIQASDIADISIDTAYLNSPVLQTGKNNSLVVKTRSIGKQRIENPVLQLSINGQVKSVASLNFAEKQENTDTLNFSISDADWQKIELVVNDGAVKFDDTFRITARSAPNLSILVLNEGQPNPYIQAAFKAYNGFRLNQVDVNATTIKWKDYNLVILNGITKIDATLGRTINEALQQGQSICIFPGKTNNFNAINEGLKSVADISINGLDTAVQSANAIQQGSKLVKDIFEKIPDNVQLPVANWHYSISAGLNANQQSILSFRNGDPFLAMYKPSKGQLYISAVSADLQSGNFPGSYFFTPFLYEMAMQSGSSSIYALTSGMQQPVYLPLAGVSERSTVHVLGNGIDIIPPQHTAGAGLEVYLDQSAQQPGFYNLVAEGSDTTKVALNQDKGETVLEFKDISALKSEWKGNIKWLDIGDAANLKDKSLSGSMPLWKLCVFFAILMLAAETILLAKPSVVEAG